MLTKGRIRSAIRALSKGIGATCVVLRPILIVFGAAMLTVFGFIAILIVAIVTAPFKHRD